MKYGYFKRCFFELAGVKDKGYNHMESKQAEKVINRIAVLGGGSFGTVLANICATNGYKTKLWLRSESSVREINKLHINKSYLPEFKLHRNVHAVSDLREAVEQADVVVVAIPSQSFRDVVAKFKDCVNGAMVISATKGIEAVTFNLMTEILEEELSHCYIGALSGPNLAGEIAENVITASVIASHDDSVCKAIQRIFQCRHFRIYTSKDPFGVQLGGALKNIYAIATGLASVLGAGENTRSMLITRALAEMSRFAVKMGADPMTFLGLSGVGDLVVTCGSSLSRNFRLGMAIGKGEKLENALAKLGQVAEGVYTLREVKAKADKLKIYMPIVSGLHLVLFENKPVMEVVYQAMLRDQKTDVEFVYKKHE